MKIRPFASTVAFGLLIQGFGVASGLTAARVLSPAERGEWSVVTLIPMTVAAFSLWGFEAEAARHVARSPRSAGTAVGQAALLSAAVGLILSGFAVIAAILFSKYKSGSIAATLIVCLSILPYGFGQLVQTSMLASGRITQFNVLRATSPASYAVIVVSLALLGALTVNTLATALLASFLFSAVMAFWAFQYAVQPLNFSLPSAKEAQALFRQATPTAALSVLTQFHHILAPSLVAAFCPLDQIGQFAVGMTFLSPVQVAANAGAKLLFNKLADPTSTAAQIKSLIVLSGAAMIGAYALALALAPLVIKFLIGGKFAFALVVMGAFGMWVIAAGLVTMFEEAVRATGNASIAVGVRACAATASLLTVVIVVRWFQPLWAIALVMTVITAVECGVVWRRFAKMLVKENAGNGR
ncbi:MAG TPA: hypothetical protein VFE23_07710 [Usitatibacter sp.]|nr:hypothetical protein [Usitatibacter sp.]